MTEDDVKAFIKWLGLRNLDICNSSQLGRVGPLTFWPVGDTDHLAEAFVRERQ